MLLILLLFVPGFALMYMLNQRKKMFTSYLEIFLAGSVLWNFIVVSSSILCGLFFSEAAVFFLPLNIIGFLIIIWFIYNIARKQIQGNFSIYFKNALHFDVLLPFTVIILIVIAVSIFHPLFLEWDSVSVYLPAGKSIALTGQLFNYYSGSYVQVTNSILLSIEYSWAYTVSGGIPHFLPIIYALFTAITIFCISKEITNSKTIALISTITFLSFPTLIHYLSVDALYADLPFIFYCTVGALFIINYLKKKNDISLLIASMALCLATLTKPIGMVFLSFLVSITIFQLITNGKLLKSMIIPLVTNGIILFFIVWNFIFYPRNSPSFFEKTVGPLVSIMILFGFMVVLIVKLNSWEIFQFKKKTSLIFLIFPIVVLIVLATWEFSNYGLIFGWGPGLKEGLDLFSLTIPSEIEMSSSLLTSNIIDFVSWHPIFLSLGLGAPFVLPLSLGLYRSFRKINIATFVVFCCSIISVSIWSFFFLNGFEFGEYRRLLYFTPWISIFVGEGMFFMIKKWKLDKKMIWYGFVSYICFIWVYIWAVYFQGPLVTNFWSLINVGVFPDLLSYNLFIFVFILIFFFIFLTKRFSVYICKRKINPKMFLTIFFLVSQLTLAQFIVIPFFQHVDNTSWDPQFYSTISDPNWGEGIFEAIDFFNENCSDNYVTLGFRIFYLSHYANRSIIDLSTASSFQTITSILKSQNDSVIIDSLFENKIRYFLIPKKSASMAYDSYNHARVQFEAIKLIDTHERFTIIADFNNFVLYKLQSPEEYQKSLESLRELFFFKNDETKLFDDDPSSALSTNIANHTKYFNDVENKLFGNSSLKLDLYPYKGDRYLVIRHQFSDVMNLSNNDFFSFYWFGNTSGTDISIRAISSYPDNQFTFSFRDNWNGWSRIIIPLSDFKILVGEPSWEHITDLAFVIEDYEIESKMTFYLDKISVDNGILEIYLLKLNQLN